MSFRKYSKLFTNYGYLFSSAVFSQLLANIYEKHDLFLVTSDNTYVYSYISLNIIISTTNNLVGEYYAY